MPASSARLGRGRVCFDKRLLFTCASSSALAMDMLPMSAAMCRAVEPMAQRIGLFSISAGTMPESRLAPCRSRDRTATGG